MAIDPNELPEDAAALRQIVIGLLEEVETKQRRLRQLQHWVKQLLRARYGPRRERPPVLPKSPEGEATAYTLSNWKALTRYLDDGDLAIDNNGAERSLRGVAVGRKNWMFYGSGNGGRTAAVLTNLIATSKRLHLDPFAYLRDLLARISSHPQSRLAALLPDQWQPTGQAAATR